MALTPETVAALADLVAGHLVLAGDDGEVVVRDVTHDSRQAGPGTLFVAVPGATHDGHDFVDEAVAAGSPAIMVQRAHASRVPQIVVTDTRAAMAPVAAAVHGWPSHELRLIGVTGTNGKTTVTHMIEAIVTAGGVAAGLIGTVHTRVGNLNIPNSRTTPESPDLQRLLAAMVRAGAEVVAAEVSSHALTLRRVDSTRFEVAAFTNLSQDHLDFHGDMEAYFAAKAELFESERSRQAVIAIDDPAGRRLRDLLRIPSIAVGAGGDVEATAVRSTIESASFVLRVPGGEAEVSMPLGARFNVDNAALAAGCAVAIGIGLDAIVAALGGFVGVPGRFEVVSGDDPVRVVVDYAHTPVGIGEAIATARHSGAERVIVVFGAGGDRDRGKRPLMGRAAQAADIVMVTSDNPRSEDPEVIIGEVLAGIGEHPRTHSEPDRRVAIAWAVEEARPGDVVLILGRGHERGQEVAGRTVPFDDRLVARAALNARRGGKK